MLPPGRRDQALCHLPVEVTVKYQSPGELREKSVVLPRWLNATSMTRAEKLELWAAALEREGDRPLRTLFEIEHLTRAKRKAARADNSPLSVAFMDPRLREEGLSGDTVGDVEAFFRISDRQLHDVVCYCHHGPAMSARAAAMRVRGLALRPEPRLAPVVVGACAGISLALAMVLL